MCHVYFKIKVIFSESPQYIRAKATLVKLNVIYLFIWLCEINASVFAGDGVSFLLS